ncbi:hypothetical protein M0805_001683 [Coniferiporia weirii]|nr:hypothetical protein M0805_001683 [Coniferiporia weirii]
MPRLNTTIDDTNPLITFSPAEQWHPGTSATDPGAVNYSGGGTFTLTTLQGATATFAFNGTGVWLYGAKRSNHGTYSVTLDGAEQESYSGNVPEGDEFQVVLFGASNLALGMHEVVLKNEGSGTETFLDIDFIRWETELGQDNYTLNQTAVQATSFSPFQFSGSGWNNAKDNALSPDTGMSTNLPGDYVALEFEGKWKCDAVSVFGSIGPSCGFYDVQMDDGVATTYNATRQVDETSQLLYYGVNLGPGQHVVRITNSRTDSGDSVNHTLSIDHAEVVTTNAPTHVRRDNIVPTGGPGPKNTKPALIGGLCGALAFMILLLLGLWLWLRRRRLGHPLKHVTISKLGKFDIDDDIPLQTHSQSGRTSAFGTDRSVTSGSRIARDSHSDTSNHKGNQFSIVVPYDFNSGDSTSSGRASYDRGSSRDASSSRLPYNIQAGKDVSNGGPYDGSSGNTKSKGKLPHNGSDSTTRNRKHRRRSPRDGSSHRKSGSGDKSRPHRPKKVSSRDRTEDSIKLGRHPLAQNVSQQKPSGSAKKKRKRSLRNSRIVRTGYNFFFAKPGSSSSGSAYAPSTVLTSEISERPATTLSPVTEAPPPLPSIRPQTSQRTLQIANQADE